MTVVSQKNDITSANCSRAEAYLPQVPLPPYKHWEDADERAQREREEREMREIAIMAMRRSEDPRDKRAIFYMNRGYTPERLKEQEERKLQASHNVVEAGWQVLRAQESYDVVREQLDEMRQRAAGMAQQIRDLDRHLPKKTFFSRFKDSPQIKAERQFLEYLQKEYKELEDILKGTEEETARRENIVKYYRAINSQCVRLNLDGAIPIRMTEAEKQRENANLNAQMQKHLKKLKDQKRSDP